MDTIASNKVVAILRKKGKTKVIKTKEVNNTITIDIIKDNTIY